MEHRKNFIGIYDAATNDEIIFDNRIIKAKGKPLPEKNILMGHFNIYFEQGFQENAPQLDGLETAFIDAAAHRNKPIDLRGVGYGKSVRLEINNTQQEDMIFLA